MSDKTQPTRGTRRSFLLLFPLSVFAGIFSSIGVAAFRLLRPRLASTSNENWLEIGMLSELNAAMPVVKKIATETVTGWGLTAQKNQGYLPPGKQGVVE